MIREFSGGYYRAEMTVQPYDDGPAIERGLHEFIEDEYYPQTDAPVTMRVGLDGGRMFTPSAEAGMPTDVLALPENFCDEIGVHPSAEEIGVFIVKPAHAYMFNQARALGERFNESSNISDNTLSEEDRSYFDIDGDR